MTEKIGILYGVGVGPGNPELLTLRALSRLRAADVLLLPQAERESCRAYRVAVSALPELAEKPWLGFAFPMTRDAAKLAAAHEAIYRAVRERLLSGQSAAFLTVGDPTVYSTFSYLAARAAEEGLKTETVSGISSWQAAAARLGLTLCEGDEPLHVGSGQGDAASFLALPGTKVLLKCGRELPRVKALLLALEQRGAEVWAISDCGLDTERIYRGAAAIPDGERYMTTVIVKEKQANDSEIHEKAKATGCATG